MNTTYTRAGVLLLLLLGVGLLIAQGPNPISGPVANGPMLLSQVQLKQDHIEALPLAKMIIEGKKDFVLVDVRTAWEYDDYHIPGAINIPMDQLLTGAAKAQMPRHKEIILYSAGGTHAAQAWVILAQSGYRTRALLDGMQGWWRDVMTPVSLGASDENAAQKDYQALKPIREYFLGGSAPVGKPNVPTTAPSSAPAPSTPAPAPAAPAGGPKKKGGGC